MELLISYIIKSIISSGILYLYYQVALKNKKFHSYNRFYLLLSIVVSLTVPLINFKWLYIEESGNHVVGNIVTTINSPVVNETTNNMNSVSILLGISGLVSLLLLLFLLSRIMWIYTIKKKNVNKKMLGFTLIETRVKQAPFSFLNNLFWKEGVSATDDNGSKIFKHELTHIIEKHSYDKLFTQLVFCIFWINPFYWLIQKELYTIHEFIADANAVEDGDTESFARMLLHSHNEGLYLSPSHQFFNSSIKRRLIMISTSNKTQYSYARRIFALPIILFVLGLLTINVKAQTDTKKVPPAKEAHKSVNDTIPGAVPVITKNQEHITVSDKKIDKNSDARPVTTTGKKVNTNSNVQTIIVSDQNINTNSQVKTTTVSTQKPKKVEVYEITTDVKPVETVVVTEQKINTAVKVSPVEVTVQDPAVKTTVETFVTVSDIEPTQTSPKKVTGKKSPKKTKQEPKPVTGKKLD